jgi:large subunit ribosomal protein L4
MEATIYNLSGKEAGKTTLREDVFALPWNADLVHQVITSMQTNARTPVAHTKTRGEVAGGGKKPWRQKGTGRARHGSTRSPIWVGGGVAHGPRSDKNFTRKVNKKMKTKAFLTILSEKYRNGEVIFVDSFNFATPKTKEAVAALKSIGSLKGLEKFAYKRTNAALIGMSSVGEAAQKSFRNIGKVKLDTVRNWNPVELLQYKYAIIVNPAEALPLIESRISDK